MKDIIFPITTKYDDKGVKQAESGLSKLGNFAEKAGLAIAAGLAVGATAAIAFGVESLKAAAEAEAITRGLENAARNAGVFGDKASSINKATAALDEHSKALGELTGIDDEIINQIKTGWLAVPSLAALGTKGLNNLAEVVADTAAGTGKDITAIGLAFQRVAGDTESAFSKLTRAGIVFTDEQKNTFQALLDTSGEMAAQQYLIEQLGNKYAGAAEAAANPFARLDVIFGNLKETIGASLLPAFEQVVPVIQEMIQSLVSDPSFQKFLESMSQTLADMLPRIQPVVTNFNDLMLRLLPGLNPLLQIMGGLIETISLAMQGLTDDSDGLFDSWYNLAFIIANVNSGLRDWNKFIDDITIDMGAFGPVVTAIFRAIERALNPVKSGLESIAALIRWINGTPVKGPTTVPLGGGRNITIPGQAEGGITTRSGLSWVGEKGPELLNLPRGAQVIPLDRMASGGGNVTNITFTVNAGMGTDGAAVGEQIVNAIRRYERTSGAVFARA